MLKRFFKHSSCISISLGMNVIQASKLIHHNENNEIEWFDSIDSKKNLLQGNNFNVLDSSLGEIISTIGSKEGKHSSPIQVVLPDPIASTEVFSIDELPRSKISIDNLVHWRMCKNFHREVENTAFTYHIFGKENNAYLVYGLIVERALINTINSVFDRNKMIVNRIDTGANYRLNLLHDCLPDNHNALVTLEDEYWTLTIRDDIGRICLIRSRWYSQPEDLDALVKKIYIDIERSIRAFSHRENGNEVTGIYVDGKYPVNEKLSKMLSEIMHSSAEVINIKAMLLGEQNHNNNVSLSSVTAGINC